MESRIENIISELKKNKLVLLKDNLGPVIKGYLFTPAYNITESTICDLVNEAKGVICAAISDSRIKELGLQPMIKEKGITENNFTVSVEARSGVSTGISAADRAITLNVLANTKDPKLDLVTPGHIFPIPARKGGVLIFTDVAEATSDLMTLAGLPQVAAFSHCLNHQGEFQTEEELKKLSEKLNISIVSMLDIIQHRLTTETIVEKIAEANLPTKSAGSFRAFCFKSQVDGNEHLALVKGEINPQSNEAILVRVHAENKFDDLFSLSNISQNNKITKALELIDQRGKGVFLYIRQSKNDYLAQQIKIIKNKTKIQSLDIALRENGVGSQILSALGVRLIELISSSAKDYLGLDAFNLKIVKRYPLNA